MNNPKTFKVTPLVFLGLTVLAVTATFFVPTPPDTANPTAVHLRAAIATAPAFLLVGSAITFLKGLGSFKAGRSAYRLLAIGMLMFSLILIQAAIWGLFDLWDTAWATSGTGIVPLLLTAIFLYLGGRKFANLLQIKTPLTNPWLAIGVTLLAGIVMGIVASAVVTYDIEGAEMYIAICSWGAAYMTFAAILMHKVSRSIGASYQLAMRWLAASIIAFCITCWHEAINTLWFNNGSTYTDYGYYLIPWTITGLVSLYASYRFRMITAFARNDAISSEPATQSDYFESILAVARLASNPDKIDPILDDLRSITATAMPGQQLTDQQKQTLLDVFHRLEKYLQHDEPLRTITTDELYSHVTPAFRQLIASEKQAPAVPATPETAQTHA